MALRLQAMNTPGYGRGFALTLQLPQPDAARPHGRVYQLHCGTPAGQTLVRYDNETGKGDHVHRGNREYPYSFATLERLLTDFEAEIQPYLGA
jgi:hypothetical protein